MLWFEFKTECPQVYLSDAHKKSILQKERTTLTDVRWFAHYYIDSKSDTI